MQLKARRAGFSLVELAVAMAIIALLLAGVMTALSAQQEQRVFDETNRRLNTAAEAILAFAMVNGRLPCPGTVSGIENPSGGGTCATNFGGYVPAQTLGIQPTNASGYLLDSWNNPIRYAVASTITGTGCTNNPHFTSTANMKTNGVSCKPLDLDVCTTVANASQTACASDTVRAAASQTIAFVVFSTGKNGAVGASYGRDETENTDGDAAFVVRTASESAATTGAFDDLMVLVPAGVLYAKLIAAGKLP